MPSYSPQLMLFGRGSVSSDFPDGREGPVDGAFFVTQLDRAVPFYVHGPAQMVGVSLNMKGWAALTGLPVDKTINRILRVDQTLPEQRARALSVTAMKLGRGEFDGNEAARDVAAILVDALHALDPEHERFITRMLEWLGASFNPSLDELHDSLPMSPRTVQRLSNRYFGRPPITLAKRYRAIRAATFLSMPEIPQGVEAQIYDSFYDQAHLIRDLRRYTGRTPKRLGGEEESLGEKTLDVKGYGNSDLFDRIAQEEARDKS